MLRTFFFVIIGACTSFFSVMGVYLHECNCLVALDDAQALAFYHQGIVDIVDAATLQTRCVLTDSADALMALDGKRVMTTSVNDNDIYVWDALSGNCLSKLSGHEGRVTALTVSSDGQLLLSGDTQGRICFWDTNELALIKTLETTKAMVYEILLIDDRRMAVSVGDYAIWVFDIISNELINRLEGHKLMIWSLVFFQNRLYSGSFDCSIREWDLESGDCLRKFEGEWFISDPIIELIPYTATSIIVKDTKRYQMLSLDTGTLSCLPGALWAPSRLLKPDNKPFFVVTRDSGKVMLVDKETHKRTKVLQKNGSQRYSLTLFNKETQLAGAGWYRESLKAWQL